MNNNKIVQLLGGLVLVVGLLMGLGFTAVATVGDLESAIFVSGLPADERLASLRCPLVMNAGETANVTADITNHSDRARLRTVRAQISIGLSNLTREEEAHFEQPAGETRQLAWEVTPEDAAYGESLILVQVYSVPNSPLPSLSGSCGIMLVNIPGLTGQQIVGVFFALTLLCITVGGGMWLASHRPLEGRAARQATGLGTLTAFVILGMAGSLTGIWIIGLAAVVLAIILSASLFGTFAR
ncbi:MAG: hypothetical protein EPO32_14510 [Anaerolineae bacterium]|nr:MAG: hypothetical protein EPO32_14510 [Anaerolineae bacterium]